MSIYSNLINTSYRISHCALGIVVKNHKDTRKPYNALNTVA